MSDAPRRIYIGDIPSGFDATFVAAGAVDPLAIMLREGHAKLDRLAAEERQREAARLADIKRTQSTRRARAARRFRSALQMFARMRI
jgi:hypothetical protein